MIAKVKNNLYNRVLSCKTNLKSMDDVLIKVSVIIVGILHIIGIDCKF